MVLERRPRGMPFATNGAAVARMACPRRERGTSVFDEQCIEDGQLVPSRKPDDIPAFNEALWKKLQGASAQRKAA